MAVFARLVARGTHRMRGMTARTVLVSPRCVLSQCDRRGVAVAASGDSACGEVVRLVARRARVVTPWKRCGEGHHRLLRRVALHTRGRVDRLIVSAVAIEAVRCLRLVSVMYVNPLMTTLAVEDRIFDRKVRVMALRARDRGVHLQARMSGGIEFTVAAATLPCAKHMAFGLERVARYAIAWGALSFGVGEGRLVLVASRADSTVDVFECEVVWAMAFVAGNTVIDHVRRVARRQSIDSPTLGGRACRLRLSFLSDLRDGGPEPCSKVSHGKGYRGDEHDERGCFHGPLVWQRRHGRSFLMSRRLLKPGGWGLPPGPPTR